MGAVSTVNLVLIFLSFKVCHSSAFQTISVISVYIRIINYRGSILANQNNKMQTKQHAMKKSFLQNQQGIFLWWNDFEQKMFKIFSSCQFSKLELYSILSFIFRGAAFFMHQRYLKQGSLIIFKTILIFFFTQNFWGKVDENYKCLNKINIVFQLELGYFYFNFFLFFAFQIFSVQNTAFLQCCYLYLGPGL